MTRRLALRVTLNSALMILVVYIVMQVVSFFRDNLILGLSGASGLTTTVFAFIGVNVLPPLLVLSVLIYLLALPIQKAQARLEAGEELGPEELEATRRRILRFSNFVLAVNLVGFAAGYVILEVLTAGPAALLRPDKLVILLSNLAGAGAFSTAQSALDNMAFAPLRERLGIYAIGGRKREARSTRRQMLLSLLLVVYALTFLQFNERDVAAFEEVGAGILARVRSGELPAVDAEEAYRSSLAAALPTFSSRGMANVLAVKAPWDRKESLSSLQFGVFLLYFAFLALVAAGIQLAVSRERRGEIDALQRRLREVVAGGGDLGARVSLRSMDDFGELAELINRLLDEFGRVVSGIGAQAARTKEGADAIARVLSAAEGAADRSVQAFLALESGLEAEAAESVRLRGALGTFRGAAAKVEEAAESHDRFVADTSAAMEEMASSIESVEGMTRRSGELAASLAGRGKEGAGLGARDGRGASSRSTRPRARSSRSPAR